MEIKQTQGYFDTATAIVWFDLVHFPFAASVIFHLTTHYSDRVEII